MPEMTFSVRWPDGHLEHCYSPSLVVHDHLEAETSYTVADFVARSTRALDIASARVAERFDFACTSAAATTEAIVASASRFAPEALVEVVRLWPPLPSAGPSAGPSGGEVAR